MDRGAWGVQSMGLLSIGHDSAHTHTHTHTHTRNYNLQSVNHSLRCFQSIYNMYYEWVSEVLRDCFPSTHCRWVRWKAGRIGVLKSPRPLPRTIKSSIDAVKPGLRGLHQPFIRVFRFQRTPIQ